LSKPFDATLKDLGREHPRHFLAAFDQPTLAPLSSLNVDLSTVTTAADLVIGLGDPLQEVIQLDFQASAAAWKHADTLVYNALLYRHYHVPVQSIVILLRPQAAHANLNGAVNYSARPGRGKMDFAYQTVPLWERPAEELLASELGILPLAILGRLPEGVPLLEGLTGVAQRLLERLEREVPPEQARRLLTAAFVLTGLRVRRDIARDVFRGVRVRRESDTYMAIIDEEREDEARRFLLLQGQERFGPADESIRARLEGITDLERLEHLGLRLLRVSGWQELFEEF